MNELFESISTIAPYLGIGASSLYILAQSVTAINDFRKSKLNFQTLSDREREKVNGEPRQLEFLLYRLVPPWPKAENPRRRYLEALRNSENLATGGDNKKRIYQSPEEKNLTYNPTFPAIGGSALSR